MHTTHYRVIVYSTISYIVLTFLEHNDFVFNLIPWNVLDKNAKPTLQSLNALANLPAGSKLKINRETWHYYTAIMLMLVLILGKEGNILFNDALNTFYLRLYGVRHMVKDHSDSERGNPLPPHGLLFGPDLKGTLSSNSLWCLWYIWVLPAPMAQWLSHRSNGLVSPGFASNPERDFKDIITRCKVTTHFSLSLKTYTL